METISETVDLSTSDGPMATVISRPAGEGRYPAVMVIHESFGLNSHIQGLTQRFAAEGYVAAAPDLFHRKGRMLTAPYSDVPASTQLREGVTDDAVLTDLRAILECLGNDLAVAQGPVGIAGYSLGGRVAFMAACKLPGIGAAAISYGVGIMPFPNQPPHTALIAQAERIACPVIGFFGGKDPAIPPAHVDEIRDTLKAKGKEAEVHLYPDAGHGFFSEERDDYNKDAADDSWSRTLVFFEQHLKQPAAAAG